jgi:hypothetical protein
VGIGRRAAASCGPERPDMPVVHALVAGPWRCFKAGGQVTRSGNTNLWRHGSWCPGRVGEGGGLD